MMFLSTHNSDSLGLFPSAPARVHSNSDIDIKLTVNRRKYFWLFAPTQLLTLG